MDSGRWLVVGLGNPGSNYTLTRHNIGFLVLDHMSGHSGASWQRFPRWKCELAQSGDFILQKPLTFMNLSGDAVQPVLSFHKIPINRLLVVHDEVALPFGTLRLKQGGSGGGHNGLSSIITRLGSNAFLRLRIGVGGASPAERTHANQDLADYVLEDFPKTERESLPRLLVECEDCLESVLKFGADVAMNRYNRKSAKADGSASQEISSNQQSSGADGAARRSGESQNSGRGEI